jgi:hypothetical protein
MYFSRLLKGYIKTRISTLPVQAKKTQRSSSGTPLIVLNVGVMRMEVVTVTLRQI